MFGDAQQSDTPQGNDQPAVTEPSSTVTPTTDSAGDYMLEDGSPAMPQTQAGGAPVVAVGSAAPNTDELLDVKRQALQQLTPLLGHLDQTPDEKFRTTMMMIQATDDDTLIRQAYEAAQNITDEKSRAQALLDVVNEINYFTQNHNDADA